MLKTRVVSALIGVPVLLGTSYLGGFYWQTIVLILAGIACWEYLQMMRYKQLHPMTIPAGALMLALLFGRQLGPMQGEVLFLSVIAMVLMLVFSYPSYDHYDLALSFFGACYTGYLFGFALLLSDSSSYLMLWYVMALTWSSDIGGYLFGSLWGHNRMTPLLSPHKTWEGAMGGLFLSVALSMLASQAGLLGGISLAEAILVGTLASGAAQLGDLLESSLKRFFEVKDSGKIIPGHGGVLDRFDSFMLVLPTVYYLLQVYGC